MSRLSMFRSPAPARVALACALALAGALAAAVSPPAPTLTTPAGDYQAAWLSLNGAGDAARVFVSWRGGVPVQFWSTRVLLAPMRQPQGSLKLLTDALRGTFARTEVELRLVSIWAPMTRLSAQRLTLELKQEDGRIAGAWGLVTDGKPAVSGTVSGELVTGMPIAPEQGWTSFYGSSPAACAATYGKPLVGDLALARPLWRSEAVSLSGWGTGADARYRERAITGTLCGGSSSPLVADGRVYLYHYRPSGDVEPQGPDAELLAKYKDNAYEHDLMRRWFSTRADVVVTCLDGATGQTLWESVWPEKQGNFQTHKWRGLNHTPTIARGVLVVSDYSWGLHAFDARTGELKWTRGGDGPVPANAGAVGPTICGGVVVWVTGGAAFGLDLQTGKEVWKAPGGSSARLMTVNRQERALILGNTSRLVEPKDGRVLWTSDFVLQDKLSLNTMPICTEDKVVAYGAAPAPPGAILVSAYTVTDEGISRAWQGEPGTGDENLSMAAANGRVYVAGKTEGLRCLDLATGRTLKAIPELQCGSNAHVIAVDDRLLYQPEGQHGGQMIHLVNATGDTFAPLGKAFSPPHNVTTAYGVMPLTNAFADGRLIIRGMDGVYCYDVRPTRP